MTRQIKSRGNTETDRSAATGTAPASSGLSLGFGTPSWPLGSLPNGVVTYVSTVAPALAARGHRISLLTSDLAGSPGSFPVYALHEDLRTRSLGARLLDTLSYRLAPQATWRNRMRRDLIRAVSRMNSDQHLDLLELEEWFGAAGWVRKALALPVHVRLHGPWFLSGPAVGAPRDAHFRLRVREEGAAIAMADVVSAPSSDVLGRVRAWYGLALPAAAVIPNPATPVSVGDRWALNDCAPERILFIGRFDRLKGGDLVIDAFTRVLRSAPEARLVFAGPDRGLPTPDGRIEHLEAYIRGRVPDALESGRITLLGTRPFAELADLRRRSLVTVVPSRYENHPGTVIEAMTLGCPVVAAAVGGIPELIQHDTNGLLHRGEDAEDLAGKILELLRNPRRAARLGEQAARDAERRHHPELVAAQFERLIMPVVERRRTIR